MDTGHRTNKEHPSILDKVSSPRILDKVNKVNKDKYRDKDKSQYKDQKDKVSILQGQDKTWSVPEPWTLVRRKVHSYLPW